MIGKINSTNYGVARGETCVATGDGTALQLTLGYTASTMKVIDMTSGDNYEYIAGMAAGKTLKNNTLVDSTGAITVVIGGFLVSAAVMVAGHAIVIYIE
jgi:hypothetical protein